MYEGTIWEVSISFDGCEVTRDYFRDKKDLQSHLEHWLILHPDCKISITKSSFVSIEPGQYFKFEDL